MRPTIGGQIVAVKLTQWVVWAECLRGVVSACHVGCRPSDVALHHRLKLLASVPLAPAVTARSGVRRREVLALHRSQARVFRLGVDACRLTADSRTTSAVLSVPAKIADAAFKLIATASPMRVFNPKPSDLATTLLRSDRWRSRKELRGMRLLHRAYEMEGNGVNSRHTGFSQRKLRPTTSLAPYRPRVFSNH